MGAVAAGAVGRSGDFGGMDATAGAGDFSGTVTGLAGSTTGAGVLEAAAFGASAVADLTVGAGLTGGLVSATLASGVGTSRRVGAGAATTGGAEAVGGAATTGGAGAVF